MMLYLVLLVAVVVLGGTLLCDHYYGSKECQRLWAEFVAMVTHGLASLGIKLPQ